MMKKKDINLSIVTAVINEGKQLHKTKRYFGPLISLGAKWIVIVDYRTNDKSANIADELGATVFKDRGESNGIVFNNKNKGIDKSTTDWVLILDADEKPDKILVKEIIETVKENKKGFVYETGFINYEFGKWFEKCDLKHKTFIRLFKKGDFCYDTSSTSEGFNIQKWKGERKVLKGKLYHYSHPTIKVFLKKIDNYSSRESGIKSKQNISIFIIIINIFIKPIKEFVMKYFIWKLYKEGIHGLIVSIIFAYYHFLIWYKTFKTKIYSLYPTSQVRY